MEKIVGGLIIAFLLVYWFFQYQHQKELEERCYSMPAKCECKIQYMGKNATPYIQYKNEEGKWITEY